MCVCKMYSHLQVAERKCETMDPDCGTRYNPWSIDDSAAGLRNALLIAEKTGHVRKVILFSCLQNKPYGR